MTSLPRRWTTWLFLVLLVLSLGLHVWTLVTLARLRQTARIQVQNLAYQIGEVQHDVLVLPLQITRPIAINTTLPVKQHVTIPVSTTIAVEENIRLGVEPFDVLIPINFDVPIRTTVPVSINETVAISTTVDVALSMPLSIPIQDTSLADYLADLEQALTALSEEL